MKDQALVVLRLFSRAVHAAVLFSIIFQFVIVKV